MSAADYSARRKETEKVSLREPLLMVSVMGSPMVDHLVYLLAIPRGPTKEVRWEKTLVIGRRMG